ncbi:hypothetical protein ZHAS_00018476 [Anopheles sinensis]|uniref:Uncharacterized protein n=1 Tax=Anopheles sinensis TaxID=74873 RepID=A0A084WJQ1_ANOSI|nr:hypothetical protein ZHAS_00018476 [Anopheles sinensis]
MRDARGDTFRCLIVPWCVGVREPWSREANRWRGSTEVQDDKTTTTRMRSQPPWFCGVPPCAISVAQYSDTRVISAADRKLESWYFPSRFRVEVWLWLFACASQQVFDEPRRDGHKPQRPEWQVIFAVPQEVPSPLSSCFGALFCPHISARVQLLRARSYAVPQSANFGPNIYGTTAKV